MSKPKLQKLLSTKKDAACAWSVFSFEKKKKRVKNEVKKKKLNSLKEI